MFRLHRMPGVSKPNYPIQHLFSEKLMNTNDVNIEEEVIKECTCDSQWGKTGCPVHDIQKKEQAENYDSWQIEMMHWGVHY